MNLNYLLTEDLISLNLHCQMNFQTLDLLPAQFDSYNSISFNTSLHAKSNQTNSTLPPENPPCAHLPRAHSQILENNQEGKEAQIAGLAKPSQESCVL